MKKYFLALLSLVFICSCSKESSQNNLTLEEGKWAVNTRKRLQHL